MVRTVFLKLHLWIGLAAGLILSFVAVTGALLVFENEIDRLLNPSIMTVRAQAAQPLSAGQLVAAFEKANPGQRAQAFAFSHSPTVATYVIARSDRVFLNQYTGQVLGKRDVRAGPMRVVHQLHTSLLFGKVGQKIVGYAAAVLLFMTVSGIVLWWKRRILWTRRSSSWWRINFDLHNFTGIYSAVFLAIMCSTGMLMTFGETFAPLIYKVTGEPPDTETPEAEIEKGKPRIGWDQAIAIADKALPGAETTFVNGPVGRNAMFRVSKRFPEDRTPGGRSVVYVHSQSGEVLDTVNSRQAHPGIKVFNWNRPIHTGDVFGWGSRVLWFAASILVLVQAAGGSLIWWKRYRTKKVTHEKEAAEAVPA